MNWEDFTFHLETQLRGSLNCIKAVAPGMIERGSCHIINIGSTHAWGAPPPNLSGYIAAKSALAALTRCAAVDSGPKGCGSNTVSARHDRNRAECRRP